MRRTRGHASLIRLALLGPALLPSAARAQDTPQVSIVEHGEFTAHHSLPPRERVEGTSGVTDFMLVEGAKFVRRTERIEAALCRRFGIWFMTPPPAPALRCTSPYA